jgi:hypothetical protein
LAAMFDNVEMSTSQQGQHASQDMPTCNLNQSYNMPRRTSSHNDMRFGNSECGVTPNQSKINSAALDSRELARSSSFNPQGTIPRPSTTRMVNTDIRTRLMTRMCWDTSQLIRIHILVVPQKKVF